MAGPNVVYDAGKFSWIYTAPTVPEGAPATELHLKWGTSPGVYPNMKQYGLATIGADVDTVLPAGSRGQFYAVMAVWNGVKEGPVSTECPFVCSDGSAGGSIQFSIG